MNLSTSLNSTKKLTGTWNDQEFWFEVKTNALTPRFLKSLTDMEKDPMGIANALSGAIPAWGIDLDGAPFPPSIENIGNCPVDFLAYLIERMGEVLGGEKKSATASPSTLVQTANTAT